MSLWPDEDDDWEADDGTYPSDAPSLEVEIEGPEILGYLYGPTGDIIATLLDRPQIPFGFTR